MTPLVSCARKNIACGSAGSKAWRRARMARTFCSSGQSTSSIRPVRWSSTRGSWSTTQSFGATTALIQRQFFLEGLFLTLLSGGGGMMVALGLCQLINLAPMPERFSGMILSWQSALLSLLTLVVIGVATSTYPARRAAELPPVEALRFEM